MPKFGDYVNAIQIPLENIITEIINLETFIVGFVTDGNYNGIFNSDFNPEIIQNQNIDNPIALTIGGVLYTKVENKIDLYNNEKTWYWDDARKLFLIRIPTSLNRWKISQMIAGVSFACYRTNMSIQEFDGIYNGTKYRKILQSVPEIREKADDLFSGITNYEGGQISIQNNQGLMSRLNEDGEFLGRTFFFESWYYSKSDPEVNLTTDFSGIISKLNIGKEIRITYKDPRDKFVENICTRVLDLDIWIDCESSYVIPKVYGTPKDCELICINEKTAGTVWKLMLADVSFLDIDGIDILYYKGNPVAAPAVQIADNVAYIEMNKTTYPEKDGFTADLSGYVDSGSVLITNPLEMIETVIEEIYLQAYNSVYYDTAIWEDCKNYVFSPSFYLKDKLQVKEFFTKISASSGGVFYIDKSTGKYTFEIIAQDLSLTIIIPEIRFQDERDRNEIQYTVDNVVQVCTIGYGKKQKSSKYKLYTDESKKAEIYNIINTDQKEKVFETDITDLEDATTAAQKYLYLFGRKLRYIEKTIPLNSETKNIKKNKFISIQFDKDGFDMGYMRAYILEVSKNFDTGSIKFSAYLFEEDNSGFKVFDDGGTIYDATFDDGGSEVSQFVV